MAIDVLLDDRDARPGVKFADADLLGIPHRVVIGERGLRTALSSTDTAKPAKKQKLAISEAANFLRERIYRETDDAPALTISALVIWLL